MRVKCAAVIRVRGACALSLIDQGRRTNRVTRTAPLRSAGARTLPWCGAVRRLLPWRCRLQCDEFAEELVPLMASAATLRTEWEMCESALLFQAVSDEPKRSVDAEALRHARCRATVGVALLPPVGPLA